MTASLRLAFVSAFPPGQRTLNEYGLHMVRAFAERDDVAEIVVLADRLETPLAELDLGPKVRVSRVWGFNSPRVPVQILRALRRERPDAVLPTMGGQTALNCALKLDAEGVLEKYGVEMIGANADTIVVARAPGQTRPAAPSRGTTRNSRRSSTPTSHRRDAPAHRSRRQVRPPSPPGPPRATPRARTGVFVAVILVVLTVGLLAMLWINTTLAQGAFVLSDLQQQRATLIESEQHLFDLGAT